jgi:hypothetical protein
MTHHVLEFDECCPSCRGSGLYRGMAEHNGFAVVCHTCNGTGCHRAKYEYDDFDGKKLSDNVHTVIRVNPGIGVGIDESRGFTKESFGGMPYKDWLDGKPFPPKSEMRKYTCPCWWYQSADYNLKPDWDWCMESFGTTFSECNHFCIKEVCWERFDKEHDVS